MTMLAEVVSAAKQVLKADRGSVWLYDPAAEDELIDIWMRPPTPRRSRTPPTTSTAS